MNESQSSPVVPPIISPPSLPELPFRSIARRLLACNPFYLISAACLLYGLYRLTIDPAFHNADFSQLSAIFGSLQAYEILLVATAIFLAWRRVWYDSTLLVFLENMLVFVPFILVTVAAFLGSTVAWVVCGTGAGMAVLKFWGLKRFIRELNLPGRLLLIGAGLLLANLVVPFIFKATLKTDVAPLAGYSRIGWLIVLPVAFAGVNLLRRPERWGGVAAQRSWLPLGLASIWFAVSAVHLYSLDYIYDLAWQPALLAPLLWVASWTLYNRFTDCADLLPREWRPGTLALPVVAMLLGCWDETGRIVFGLAALNAAIYGALYYHRREAKITGHLLLVSLTAMIAAMPEGWGKLFSSSFNRPDWVMCAIVAYVIAHSLISRNPLLGLAGAVATTLAGAPFELGGNYVLQAGLVYLLIHSLRWDSVLHSAANGLRIIIVAGWVWHSASWVFSDDLSSWMTAIAAMVILLGCLGIWCFFRRWVSTVLPVAAGLVILLIPAKWLVTYATSGLIAVLAAFVLFGAGTAIALLKEKWVPLEKSPSP